MAGGILRGSPSSDDTYLYTVDSRGERSERREPRDPGAVGSSSFPSLSLSLMLSVVNTQWD